MQFRIAFLGDIVGHPGRAAVAQQIPVIRSRWQPHLILANAENAASGSGLTPDLYHKLVLAGVDGITLGDHVYRKVQITSVLEQQSNIIRPANLPAGAVGKRWMKLTADLSQISGQVPANTLAAPVQPVNLYVLTVLGRLYSTLPLDEPFAVVERILAELPEKDPLVILEVHAEATSEKQALARRFEGRVAAVVGTHTHVPTADARVLPRGTAYMTDLGMCGPFESIIGRRIDRVIEHMTTSMPHPFDVAEGDPRVCGALITLDVGQRRAVGIERIELAANPSAPPFVAGRL